MLPKEPHSPISRTATAFSYDTVIPPSQQHHGDFSIDAAVAEPDNYQEEYVRFWSTRQVVVWMISKGVDAPIVDTFELNDINGAALMDLVFDHLKELDIQSLGKRLSLWNEICQLRGGQGSLSPAATPFQDISRPCTTVPQTLPDRGRESERSRETNRSKSTTPSGGKKRRGRKASKQRDIVTPAESVSIVAIEQLLPKPHKCDKGERCSKWRKQQREIDQLQSEHGLGTFPISPKKGGHVFVYGDPGNPMTAANIIPNVHKQQPIDESGTLTSDVIPSIVASSDLLGPGQVPEFTLHERHIEAMAGHDPQDNVRQYLNFQHMQFPPELQELAVPGSIGRSESVPLFPAHHYQAYPSLSQPVRSQTSGPREDYKSLPRLEIPRSSSANANRNFLPSADSCRTASPINRTISPKELGRFGTPASEMDVPLTAIPTGPVARDASQSVPPDMIYRQQSPLSRSQSTRNSMADRRRPSMTPLSALPAVKEGEVLPPASQRRSTRPSLSSHNSSDSSSSGKQAVLDPAHHEPNTQYFGYGSDCTQAGWMKKRRTKLLRHEWQEAHFRLKGSNLAMHDSARLSSAATDTINVEDYAVACSSVASGSKLSAAMKAFYIKNSTDAAKKTKNGESDPAAFAFQLVPSKDGDKKVAASSKTHHFAVKNKDQRIDWMREIMLAKALQQKGKGYEVEVNGVQA
jgi:hypothetical protein